MNKALCLMGAFVTAAAAASAATSGETAGTGGPVAPSLLRLLAALAAVVALVYTTSIMLRFLVRRRVARGSRSLRSLHVLEVLPLGAKAKLIAVRVGRRVVLIGAGESQVNHITEMDADEYSGGEAVDEAPAVPFKQRLLRLAKK